MPGGLDHLAAFTRWAARPGRPSFSCSRALPERINAGRSPAGSSHLIVANVQMCAYIYLCAQLEYSSLA